MAETVRQAVASGEHESDSEVIREALQEWKLCRQLRQHEREELQRMWAEGLASGPGRLGTMPSSSSPAVVWSRTLDKHAKPNSKTLPHVNIAARPLGFTSLPAGFISWAISSRCSVKACISAAWRASNVSSSRARRRSNSSRSRRRRP
jgi:hypothetical protein